MVLKQRPPLLVTVSTAVLLVLGGAAAYFGISQRLSATTKLPAGMELVPNDALVTLTLTTDEIQWTRLRQLGTPESQKVLDRFLVTWRDRIISNHGYRFRTHIEPWIGKQVTLAFLPKSGSGDETTEQVLIAPIDAPLKAQELLSEPQDNVTWVGRDYKDIQIQSITTTTGETFESAVLESKWLVVASGAKGIEAVIDSFTGGETLANNDAYRQAMKKFKMPSALAQFYVNTPVAAKILAGSDTLPGINGLVGAAALLPNGLDIEAVTWLGPEDQPVYRDMANTRARTLQHLPASTVLMVSTSSIEPMWQALNTAERLNAMLPILPSSLAQELQAKTGLDFENDILPWLSGEIAFGLVPPSKTTQVSSIPMGQLALVATVNDREAAKATWDHMDEVMVNRFRFDLQPWKMATLPISQLASHSGGIAMGYGWLEKNVTFFGVGAEILDVLTPTPDKPLPSNQAFKTLLSLSPQESSGYFFMDVESIRELKGTLPFPTLPEATVVSAIKSIGVNATVRDEKSLRYDIFVELPKGRRVRPLSGRHLNKDTESEDAKE